MKTLNLKFTALVAIAVLLGTVFFTSCSKNEVYEPQNVTEVRPELREIKEGMTDPIVICEIARKKHDCKRGFWFCSPNRKVSSTYELSGREVSLNLNQMFLVGEKLHIEFSSQLPESPEYFFAETEEEITMNNLLGYSSITLVPGNYEIDYTENIYGTIELDCIIK
ncbi:hypothetical protein N9Y90_01010 [Flavobacteriales bacterium]|nr:hypothetical protein [Flavobacteriales bacterium]